MKPRTPLFAALLATLFAASAPAASWWPASTDSILNQCGTNRAQLLRALEVTPVEQRRGMTFLIENMPAHDLESLSASFLRENVSLAYDATEKFPWATNLPSEMFLNDVLPYASVSEPRDN